MANAKMSLRTLWGSLVPQNLPASACFRFTTELKEIVAWKWRWQSDNSISGTEGEGVAIPSYPPLRGQNTPMAVNLDLAPNISPLPPS